MLSHAMDNGRHEICREYGIYVNKVEHHRHNEKAIPPEFRHGKDCG
jgi:hypothetical protein